MKDNLQKLFSLWLILTPFIMWKRTYEGPKMIYFLVGSFAVFVFWIIKILKDKTDFEFCRSDYFYLIWLIVLTAASFAGIHPLDSILGGSYRHQGVLFFLALWIIGKTVFIMPNESKKLLIKGIGLSVLIESAIVLLQVIGNNFVLGKSLGTIGEANAVTGFLAIGIFFVFESFQKFYLILPFAAVLIGMSRSGILAALTSSAAFFIHIGKRLQKILPAVIIVAVILLIVISGERGSSPFENRQVIWNYGISSIFQKPLLGYGAESGEAVYNTSFYKHGFPLFGLIVDRSHNLILDVLMWSGVVGLIFFAGWVILTLKDLKSIEKKLAFSAFLIYSMFQPLSIVHWILVIIIVNI